MILALHFDACCFQRDKNPGLWRTGPIAVTGPGGTLEYDGPDESEVVPLMAEVVEWLAEGDLEADVVVRAAMAHLHVVSVHPFDDGNGRIARIVQSLVLARERFALRSSSRSRSTSGWVGFCVEAHIAQARRRLAQIEQAAARWLHLEGLVNARGWPERLVIALEQSLHAGSDRGAHGQDADETSASRRREPA